MGWWVVMLRLARAVMGWQDVITKRRLGSDRFHEK
jgi:hypothetical protein